MKEVVLQEIKKIFGGDVVLEKPKDKTLAHYASPVAFSLAKELRKSPKIIAQELEAKFNESEISGANLLKASSLNGYLNFHIEPNLIDKMTSRALNLGIDYAAQSGENFDEFSCKGGEDKICKQNSAVSTLGQNAEQKNVNTKQNSIALGENTEAKSKPKQTTLLEYISANPTGPLHIGHVRGAVYGDTLQRVSNYLGYKMQTEYYINDAGNQIELLATSIGLRAKEVLFGESVQYPEKYYRGEYIEDIAHKALQKFGKEIFYDESRADELANFGKDEVIKIIKADLADADIKIENYVSEVSLYPELDATIEKLEQSSQMYRDNAKVWIRSTALNDEKDRVVVREDGRPTYLAGDIVYHNNKFERKFDRYINIWGADHHGYIARLKAAVNFLGYDESRLDVVLMQMVGLLKDGKPYKMSKRSGTTILMSDVLKEIGKDAMRFIFISKKCDTPLEFDLDELKREDSSNPIFYINYAHARVNQIFTKAGKNPSDIVGADLANLSQDGLNLAFDALSLNDVLNDALSTKSLQKIPDYLKNLAANFHKYYNENRVVGSANEDAQLKLFALVALCIKTAFYLMGLEAKEKMQRE